MEKSINEFFLQKADKKYFLNYLIFSRDNKYNIYWLNFKWGLGDHSPHNFNDRVKVGETLEESVRRCLATDLGIDEIISIEPVRKLEPLPDKEGLLTPVFGVFVEVPFKEVKAKQGELEIFWVLKEKNFSIDESDFPGVTSEIFEKREKDRLTHQFQFIHEPAENPYIINFLIWDGRSKVLDLASFVKKTSTENEIPTNKKLSVVLSLKVENGERLREVLWKFFRKFFYFSEYEFAVSDFIGNFPDRESGSLASCLLSISGQFIFKSKPFGEWKNIPFDIESLKSGESQLLTSKDNDAVKLLNHSGYKVNRIVWRSRVQNSAEDPEEAVAYLERGGHFQGNRFGSQEEALNFVRQLYNFGAEKVIADHIYGSGFLAMFMKVLLPAELEKRQSLFEIYNKEVEADYGEDGKIVDKGQKEFDLSWD